MTGPSVVGGAEFVVEPERDVAALAEGRSHGGKVKQRLVTDGSIILALQRHQDICHLPTVCVKEIVFI